MLCLCGLSSLLTFDYVWFDCVTAAHKTASNLTIHFSIHEQQKSLSLITPFLNLVCVPVCDPANQRTCWHTHACCRLRLSRVQWTIKKSFQSWAGTNSRFQGANQRSHGNFNYSLYFKSTLLWKNKEALMPIYWGRIWRAEWFSPINYLISHSKHNYLVSYPLTSCVKENEFPK